MFVEGLGSGELGRHPGSQELGLLERREGQRECCGLGIVIRQQGPIYGVPRPPSNENFF